MHADQNSRLSESTPRTTRGGLRWLFFIVSLLALIGGFLAFERTRAPAPDATTAIVLPPPGGVQRNEPAISPDKLHRLKQIAPAKQDQRNEIKTAFESQLPTQLPDLEKSDPVVKENLNRLIPNPVLAGWLIDQYLLQKFVAVIDNMANGEIPRKLLPIRRPSAVFSVNEKNNALWLDSASYVRFDSYADLLEGIDVDLAISLYQHFYPLMQKAYGDLGYPNRSFHRTFIKAIEQVLSAPIIEGDIELISPSVFYKFRDPKLEQLSTVQKQMIRMGPKNMGRIQSWLESLLLALARLSH